ncbi:tetratricopeptide repeat protein [Sphingomonas arenae]|uniref:tetratricopeptide repeat protein n=1 Tax=Sphingomonas arenae TaxID=2812555 RepID=UPI00196714F7|nr:tetratricopeptide repeat protein [Sphingomonas arenae]
MTVALEGGALDRLRSLVIRERWDEVIATYQADASPEEKRLPGCQLAYAIAQVRTGQETSGLRLLQGGLLSLPGARDDVRKFVIPYLLDRGRVRPAAELLDDLARAGRATTADHRLLTNLLAKQGQLDQAARSARRLVELDPEDLPAKTSCLQLLLSIGEVEEAGAYAEGLRGLLGEDSRLAAVALIALTRSGRTALAADLATELSEGTITHEVLAAAIVRTLLQADRLEEAVSVGEQLIDEGWDDAAVRSALGQAYMGAPWSDRYERAAVHLRAGLRLAPEDGRLNLSLGEVLLRTRHYAEALGHLELAVRHYPRNPQVLALHARALKQNGHHAEAAAQFRKLVAMQPSSTRWQRYAAGALSQAGHREEAASLFAGFVAERRKALPKNFEKGLNALWERVDSLDIPRARLDWAWNLKGREGEDRHEWERRAKWGHLADHYLLDWLECRDDRVHEAMLRLADLSEPERILNGIDQSRGIILASAHIGPMYAGPLALELLGIRSKWLASTPSVARTAYASSLISTSDQDDAQVARAFVRALKQGHALVLAVDGAINLGAPRIEFAGQEMTYSSFAARTAHRMGVPSLFCAPRWEGDRIGFVLERMPDPLPDEPADSHADRWRDAFLSAVRTYLSGEPENLRLSGGLWRHMR